MGKTTERSMATMKLACIALLLAINLHQTAAQNGCLMPPETITYQATLTDASYSCLSAASQACAAACVACGQTAGTDTAGAGVIAGPGLGTAAAVQNIGAAICPTITYTATEGAADSNAAWLGVPAPVADNINLAPPVANTQGLGSASQHMRGTTAADAWDALGANAARHYICPCTITAARSGTACSCAFLGVPTSAPTAIPTTAPTASTSSPTNGGASYNTGDNDLSGGAIAGIVIGSIVGAALIIGAGVMIGSK